MTEGIIVRGNGDENEIVNIGDNLPISMKFVQSIYNEITGKVESRSKILRNHHEINFHDLKQLNTKILQLYEQYNVVSKNCAITVYHVDDCKEQFSSFERFEMYDTSNTNPCENIRLEYNFLIVLPATKKAQPNKIIIDLHSRIALRKKAQSEHGLARRIIRLVATQSGNIEIEYVDYTVARNYMVAIEQWYKSVKQNKSSRVLEALQDKSEHFPFLFRILTSLIVLSAIFYNRNSLVDLNATLQTLFSVGLLSFGAIYIGGLIASKLGSACEGAIDSYQPISGVMLNRGDDLALQEFKESNSKSLRAFLLSSGLAVLENLIAAYVAIKMGFGS